MRNGKKSVIGDPINFRGMAHSPTNEAGVVALFAMVCRDLGFYVQEMGTEFPDCIARRENGKGWEELAIEFEYESHSFKDHKHDPNGCDLIVCWTHDWLDCPPGLAVLKLSEEIKRLPNHPIKRSNQPF